MSDTSKPVGASTSVTQPPQLLERPGVQMLLLVLVAVLAYANSFRVPFLFDDESSIVDNRVVHGLGNFFHDNAGYQSLPNRFVGYLSFALNYQFGGLDVAGYHYVNLAVHISAGLLVYLLVRITCQTPCFGISKSGSGLGDAPAGESAWCHNQVAFLVGLLFICHPVQTQAVTYIVQRLTSLTTVFYLAALVCHVRWRLADVSGARFFSARVLPWFVGSLLAAVLAMKTKEIAFTLPFAVVLFEFSFFGIPHRSTLAKLVPMLLTSFIIPATIVNLRKPAGEILSDVHSATAVQTAISRLDYLCTQFSVIVTYLRLLLFPVNQNLDYDYPVSRSLLEPRTLFSLLLLVVILGIALWLWRKSCQEGWGTSARAYARLAAFGLLWFFLTLSVESSIIPIVDVIFEHRLYLPSVGFFIAVVALVLLGAEKLQDRFPAAGKTAMALVGVGALLLAGATYARNMVWNDPVALWQDVKRKSPGKARPYVNLGTYYGDREQVEGALREFESAAKIDPKEPHALSNLVLLYLVSGRPAEAADACSRLRQVDPHMEGVFKLYQILRMPDDGNPAFRAVRDACRS